MAILTNFSGADSGGGGIEEYLSVFYNRGKSLPLPRQNGSHYITDANVENYSEFNVGDILTSSVEYTNCKPNRMTSSNIDSTNKIAKHTIIEGTVCGNLKIENLSTTTYASKFVVDDALTSYSLSSTVKKYCMGENYEYADWTVYLNGFLYGFGEIVVQYKTSEYVGVERIPGVAYINFGRLYCYPINGTESLKWNQIIPYRPTTNGWNAKIMFVAVACSNFYI